MFLLGTDHNLWLGGGGFDPRDRSKTNTPTPKKNNTPLKRQSNFTPKIITGCRNCFPPNMNEKNKNNKTMKPVQI